MANSGETAYATVDDTAVPVTQILAGSYGQISVINEGAAPGFYSLDGGVAGSWERLPASGSVTLTPAGRIRLTGTNPVQIKRVTGGTNLSGVYVIAK